MGGCGDRDSRGPGHQRGPRDHPVGAHAEPRRPRAARVWVPVRRCEGGVERHGVVRASRRGGRARDRHPTRRPHVHAGTPRGGCRHAGEPPGRVPRRDASHRTAQRNRYDLG